MSFSLVPSQHVLLLCKMFLGTPQAFHRTLVDEVICAAVRKPGEQLGSARGSAAAMAAAMTASAGDETGTWQAGFGCTELGERLRALGPAGCRQVYVSALLSVIGHCAILSGHALPLGPLRGDAAKAAVRAGTQAVRAACGAAFTSGQDLGALDRAEEEDDARRAREEMEDKRAEDEAAKGITGAGSAVAGSSMSTERRARAATRIARSM